MNNDIDNIENMNLETLIGAIQQMDLKTAREAKKRIRSIMFELTVQISKLEAKEKNEEGTKAK